MKSNPQRYLAFEGLPGWSLDRVRQARVLVVGCGALGNEVLKNLALMGVGELYLMDFDVVETSNLSRSVLFREADQGQPKAQVAARALQSINPEIKAIALEGDVMVDLGLGLLRHMDAVIGCVDNRLARLWLNRLCFRVGKPWISGGILNLSGQVTGYAPDQACYECGLGEAAWRDIRHRMGCPDMARRYAATGQLPTTPIAASVIGAWQAQEALKLILENGEPTVLGKMWSLEGAQLQATVYDLQPPGKPGCRSHETVGEVHGDASLTAEMPLAAMLDWLEERWEQPALLLDHDVATAVATSISKKVHPMTLPLPHLSENMADRIREIEGEAVGVPRGHLWSVIDRSFPDQGAKLRQLGIPSWHILRVRVPEGCKWVELAGDAGFGSP